MQFLFLASEASTLQYAIGGILTCGAYLLVTRGRALRRTPAQRQAAAEPETVLFPPPPSKKRRAA